MSKDTIIALHAEHQGRWKNREEIAEHMIALIGQLYREKNIVTSVFGRSLVNRSVIQILKAHRRTRVMDVELSVVHTFPILEALAKVENIGSAEIDLGKLAVEFKEKGGDIDAFVAQAVESLKGNAETVEPKDVVLYGFGRIGRILARLIIGQSGLGRGLNLKAIVVRKSSDGDLEKRASLLRRDSIHGPFSGTISVDEENEAIIANGNFIKVIYASSPAEVDYTAYGINNALVIDNTGIWKDEEGLGKHLQSKGVQKVLLTAPAGGTIKNVVYAVNSDTIGDDKIVSAASCTTNAITPTLKVLNDEYGIENGHVETIHSFTNDQNLIDNYHKADRRGRSAVLNMVITSTGAAKAVGKALPELSGKLTGNAIRVPTPNVSLAILNLNLKTAPASADALNEFMRKVSNSSQWQTQIAYTDSTEAVSTDFVGDTHVGIVDAQATILTDNHAIVYIWYDNEVGYSTQVLRLATQMAGISYTQITA